MKILPLHTQSLMQLGYTEEEARFLYLVATHSGYFTCQQFLRFVNGKPGKRSLTLARKVLEKKHATSEQYLRNGRVYHLFSRNLYQAIGRENVRFRRVHSTEYIRTRLAALDFILARPEYVYLETEEQKLLFFSERLGIDKKYLPAKRYAGAIKGESTDLYFVDKFPMFYPPGATPLPVVFFTFVDPGLESLDSFETHLRAYLPYSCNSPRSISITSPPEKRISNGPKSCFSRCFTVTGTRIHTTACSTISACAGPGTLRSSEN